MTQIDDRLVEQDNDNGYTHRLTAGFLKINRRYKRFMHRALAEYGVEDVAYTYVMTLAKNPNIHQDQLAYLQGVDKSHVTRVIRELELSGYVSRELYPSDRRRHMLNLTPSGRELYILIKKIIREWDTYIIEGIVKEDLITTIQTINRIVQSIDG